jgi:glycosyltransferase involved in cell wall biosynthesis
MNVCIVASGDFFSDYGGGQVYVRNIVDELAHHSEIATTVISFNANLQPSIKDYNDIQVHVVNDETSLYNALKSTKPDIVHANGEKLITSRLCKQLNIPCIVTAHHGGIVCPAGSLLNTDDEICNIPADYNHCLKCYLRNTPTGLFWYPLLKKYSQKYYCHIGERLEKLPSVPFLTTIGRTGQIVTKKLKDWKELAATATHFIAPSNAIAEALKRDGCPSDKITVIPHGIPIHQTSNIKHQTSNIHFYYVGRINHVKGIHVLLKAFSSIDNPNIILHLIGGSGNKSEQKYQNQLKRKYRKDTRIIWHGKIPSEQMSDIIKDFHCLVHPAIYLEVFGLNISEALAQNKYVIATRCGGAEMQIHNEDEGMLVNPNDIISLNKAIRFYIDTPKDSNANVKKISEHINNLLTLYSKLAR